MTIETSLLEDHFIPSCESEEGSALFPAPLPAPHNQDKRVRPPPHEVAQHQPQVASARKALRQRVYDLPGRKLAAGYESDSINLRASCQRRGGADFACEWILIVFKDGVTLDALTRRLKLTEIEAVNFPGGFELCLAYDGFLEMVDDIFECSLCAVGERVWWKNKKDAVRHLRKFHFGLADQCTTWYVIWVGSMYLCLISLRLPHSRKSIYSTGEMNSHRCTPPQNSATPAAHGSRG